MSQPYLIQPSQPSFLQPAGNDNIMTEADFVAQCAAARPRLVRLAAIVGVSTAWQEDIVQETMVVAWQQRAALRDPQRLHAWLAGICRHLYAMHLRRERRLVSMSAHAEEGVIADVLPDLDEALDGQTRAQLLDRALSYLTPGARQTVILCYMQALTTREAAARLGIAPAAVDVRLHRARQQLRHILNGPLRAAAQTADLALDPAEMTQWRASREWCHWCGAQHMRALFIPTPQGAMDLCLRCDACAARFGADTHTSAGLVSVASLHSIKPALKRVIEGVNTFYLAALTQPAPCPACGATLDLHLTSSAELHDRYPYRFSWVLTCTGCAFQHAVWVGSIAAAAHASLRPLIERFMRTHPRWHIAPDGPTSHTGTEAILCRLLDASSHDHVTFLLDAQGSHVLHLTSVGV